MYEIFLVELDSMLYDWLVKQLNSVIIQVVIVIVDVMLA